MENAKFRYGNSDIAFNQLITNKETMTAVRMRLSGIWNEILNRAWNRKFIFGLKSMLLESELDLKMSCNRWIGVFLSSRNHCIDYCGSRTGIRDIKVANRWPQCSRRHRLSTDIRLTSIAKRLHEETLTCSCRLSSIRFGRLLNRIHSNYYTHTLARTHPLCTIQSHRSRCLWCCCILGLDSSRIQVVCGFLLISHTFFYFHMVTFARRRQRRRRQ